LRGPIVALALEPRPPGTVKLAGTDFWRLRVGDLRVIYVVDDAASLVVVLRVARRSESTYRRVDPR
jgi:mRNA interferase RelE/StbE